MVIIDLSYYEWDFCEASTENTGALNVRTFDIDMEYSMFLYEFEKHSVISISRYDEEDVETDIWDRLLATGFLYPNISLTHHHTHFINPNSRKLTIKLDPVH